ncbi:MAG: hypothetical protein EOL88_01495 [Bacteroidia bacterium]|nr:hypothetical protein [Bacteroidia bacterium]
MISKVLADSILINFPELISGESFFLEKAVGNKNVVLKTIANTNPVKSIKNMRYARLHVNINGWRVKDAIDFGNRMFSFIYDIRGNFSYNEIVYQIKEVEAVAYPYPIEQTMTDGLQVVIFKFGVYYVII